MSTWLKIKLYLAGYWLKGWKPVRVYALTLDGGNAMICEDLNAFRYDLAYTETGDVDRWNIRYAGWMLRRTLDHMPEHTGW